MLDIATGGGMFGTAVANKFHDAAIVAVDWPDVVRVAVANAERANLAIARWRAMHSPQIGVASTISFCSLTFCIIPITQHALLARVSESLAPAGRALVIEFILNEDRVSPAMFAFMMLGKTQRGDAFTAAEYTGMGHDAGFRTASLHPYRPHLKA